MNEKLRVTVERLFADAPKTRRALELQEELLGNLNEKYNDLIAQGIPEEEALKNVVSGIGDVEELIRGLKETDVMDHSEVQRQRKKTATVVTSALALIMLGVLILILGVAVLNLNPVVMTVIMIAMIVTACCMLVYHFLSRPKYVRADDTLVEEFKQWKSNNARSERLRKSVSSILWMVTVVIYFLVGFLLPGTWTFSWLIFLIAAAVDRIIKLAFELREERHE
ncbi:MAG TPA: permease prefix domain 1-containing protein [Feifaniaceae bacterium]|nr:permease prefix domain 1-containing protein [Feifaniaceae bacterium]